MPGNNTYLMNMLLVSLEYRIQTSCINQVLNQVFWIMQTGHQSRRNLQHYYIESVRESHIVLYHIEVFMEPPYWLEGPLQFPRDVDCRYRLHCTVSALITKPCGSMWWEGHLIQTL